jgi:hypothetical protein
MSCATILEPEEKMYILLYAALLLGYIYEDNDSLIVYSDTLTICGSHAYAIKVHVSDNAELFIRGATGAPDSTGWLTLTAPTIMLDDSSSIDGSEKGYKGGYLNSHPWGYGPGGGSAGGVSGGAGGGGGYGGNGGAGGDYYGGTGGTLYGDPVDTIIQMGSGGGAGRLSVVISNGGSGGASLCLRGSLVEINSSSVKNNGQNGDTGAGLEASGGGAGGGIMVWADSVILHDLNAEANGGNGGDAAFGGGGGGSGGRVKVLFSSHIDTSDVTYRVQGGAGGVGDPGLPGSTPGDSGTVHIDVFTGITEAGGEPGQVFRVHPNPTHGILNVKMKVTPANAKLYDISGRLVMNMTILDQYGTVDVGKLQRGVYFMIVEDHDIPPCKIILID